MKYQMVMIKENLLLLEANWRICTVLFWVQTTIATTVVRIWDWSTIHDWFVDDDYEYEDDDYEYEDDDYEYEDDDDEYEDDDDDGDKSDHKDASMNRTKPEVSW